MNQDTSEMTAAGVHARDIDGDGQMEFAGANPLYLGITGFGIAMMIASLMTWATAYDAFDVTVTGMERAGVGTMIIGAALVVFGLLGWAYNPWSDPEAMWSLVLGVIAIAISIWQMIDISGGLVAPDIGGGLWLTLISAAGASALAAVILFAPEP